MSRTRRTITKAAAILALATVLPGLAAQHLIMDRGPKPAPSEFGLGPRRSSTGAFIATLEPAAPLSGMGMQRITRRLTDSTGAAVDSAAITVGGGMPAHGHGYPTAPRITGQSGAGRYEVGGVRFSRPGWWTLSFRISAAAGTDSVTFNLKL